MITYSVLMPYYSREQQLWNTLYSLAKHYEGRQDYEVIIMEDYKNFIDKRKTKALNQVLSEFQNLPIHSFVSSGVVYNPSFAYNHAAKIAKGEYLIITNPECLHDADILSGLDTQFVETPNVYVVCAAKATQQNGSFWRWHQHSIHNNKQFHFCSALSKKNYEVIGGFDERFGSGYCFDDDAFRARIIQAGIKVIERDDLQVTHQWHEKNRPPNWKALWEHNKKLFEENYAEQIA